ncbi:hypothetical protein WJX73_004420 [Symbiochloris irregularis]|uniref:Transcriptional regulator n=1 Tax=Symbiochloris irregularis TaxID=706552 RepID=A0AAW1P028_9CHLO
MPSLHQTRSHARPALPSLVQSAPSALQARAWQHRQQPCQQQQQQCLFVCRAEAQGSEQPEAREPAASPIPDSLPMAGADTDWREFRARLIYNSGASAKGNEDLEPGMAGRPNVDDGYWAHAIAGPEQGCLLIAHPLMFLSSQRYFHQAVILLLGHDETGSYGLILNSPSQHKIGQVTGAESLCPEFAQNELFVGGDVGRDSMHMIHNHRMLPGSREIVKGVHTGGFDQAKTLVREGKLDPHSIRWFTRYSGWGRAQLQGEVDKGVWFCAAAGAALISQPHSGLAGQGLWHEALDLMGGEYRELSTALKQTASYRPDVMGHGKFHPKAEDARKAAEERLKGQQGETQGGAQSSEGDGGQESENKDRPEM